MLGAPEAETDARAAIAVAARSGDGDGRAGGLGYLALQLALGLVLGSGSGSGVGGYRESVEAAAQARSLLGGADLDAARRCLDVQLALASALGGSCAAALAAGRRTLAGLGPGERWLHGYVAITAALALYRQPGRRPAGVGAAAGGACALDLLGWLAADDGRFERSAWLLGAAQARWELAGGRLGGNPVVAGRRGRSAAAARRPVGGRRRAVRGAAGVGGGHGDRADRRARGGGR